MLKTVAVAVSVSILTAGAAMAAPGVDVKVNAPPPPGVNVQIGGPPAPQTRIIEKERVVVVKDKKDQGKHKGHYKQKKHKKH